MTTFIERVQNDKGEQGIRVNLHAGQRRMMASEKRIILALKGFQGGGTSVIPLWLHREIERRGPGEYLAASSTFPLFELKLLPIMREYFCATIGWGVYNAGKATITSHDGSTVIFLRSAHNPDGLESGTFKGTALDEWGQASVGVAAWDAVMRRLAVHQGRALITTTPYTMGWLKQQVYDRAVGGNSDYDLINFRSIDNPVFPRAEWDRLKALWPDWKFRMFCEGLFTRPAGMIYGDYHDSCCELTPVYAEDDGERRWPIRYDKRSVDPNEHGHLVRPFTIPPTWGMGFGVDFGEVNCGRVWAAEEPKTGCFYLCREALGGGRSGPEYAREVLEYKDTIAFAYGGARSEAERRREWQFAGLGVQEPLIFELEAGIDHAIGLFRQNRLFVFDTLVQTRSELGTYSRELDAAGEPTEKIADKEKFHLLDALRYLASGIPIDPPGIAQWANPVPPPDRTEAAVLARLEYGRPKTGRGSEEF